MQILFFKICTLSLCSLYPEFLHLLSQDPLSINSVSHSIIILFLVLWLLLLLFLLSHFLLQGFYDEYKRVKFAFIQTVIK